MKGVLSLHAENILVATCDSTLVTKATWILDGGIEKLFSLLSGVVGGVLNGLVHVVPPVLRISLDGLQRNLDRQFVLLVQLLCSLAFTHLLRMDR